MSDPTLRCEKCGATLGHSAVEALSVDDALRRAEGAEARARKAEDNGAADVEAMREARDEARADLQIVLDSKIEAVIRRDEAERARDEARAEVERQKNLLYRADCDRGRLSNEADTLRAENERLREENERLRDLQGMTLYTGEQAAKGYVEMKAEVERLREALARLVSREEAHLWRDEPRSMGPGHAHLDGGHWDADNREPYAGRVCRWCEAWRLAEAALSPALPPAPLPLSEEATGKGRALLASLRERTSIPPAPVPAAIDPSEICAEPQDHLAFGRVLAQMPDAADPAPAPVLCAYCGDAIDMPRSRRTNDCAAVYCSDRCMAKGEAPPEPESAPAPAVCEVCGGNGWTVDLEVPGWRTPMGCPACHGTGRKTP